MNLASLSVFTHTHGYMFMIIMARLSSAIEEYSVFLQTLDFKRWKIKEMKKSVSLACCAYKITGTITRKKMKRAKENVVETSGGSSSSSSKTTLTVMGFTFVDFFPFICRCYCSTYHWPALFVQWLCFHFSSNSSQHLSTGIFSCC